jgi:hypothetical protein
MADEIGQVIIKLHGKSRHGSEKSKARWDFFESRDCVSAHSENGAAVVSLKAIGAKPCHRMTPIVSENSRRGEADRVEHRVRMELECERWGDHSFSKADSNSE